jgi:hypothetical protein
MMRGTRLLKGVKPHDRANGYAVIEIGCLVLVGFYRAIRPSIHHRDLNTTNWHLL